MNFRQVHLDFHTSEKISDIGCQFDKKQFQEALKVGCVNSITLFSKCHHGWAYHPSKANKTHPHLKFDLLGEQIAAAHEIGVKTPVYLSAGYDEKTVREHPEWRYESINHDFDNFSKAEYHTLCMNTPYLDYLLEQIKEVLENYDADGIFLDIVGVCPCCCSKCIHDMLENGLDPNEPKDVLKLAEKTYKHYLESVNAVVESTKPGTPIFHNGGHIKHGKRDFAYANTHLELESLPTGGWGYDHFPVSARYAWNLGLEYMGMTGRFHKTWGEFGGYKHPNALRYEAALSVAHGAKCSVGDQLAPNGKMDMHTYEMIGAAYEDIKQKEEWLSDVTPVCDIAVLSLESNLNDRGIGAVNGFELTKSDIGAGRILLEGKYLFSVIDSEADLSGYKVIILPDGIVLSDDIACKLKKYVANGGKLLATGISGLKDNKFLFDFGVEYIGKSEFRPSYIRPLLDNDNGTDYIMYSECEIIKNKSATVIAEMVKPYFNRTASHFCSHFHSPSSGEVGGTGVAIGNDGAYISWKIFEDYAENGEIIAKQVVCKTLDIILGNKSLVTNLGSMGVATLMKQNMENRLVAHLLYAVPTKRGKDTEIIEDIYPVHDVVLKIRTDKKFERAYLAPQNTDLSVLYEDGYAVVDIEKLNCHQMVVFDYKSK